MNDFPRGGAGDNRPGGNGADPYAGGPGRPQGGRHGFPQGGGQHGVPGDRPQGFPEDRQRGYAQGGGQHGFPEDGQRGYPQGGQHGFPDEGQRGYRPDGPQGFPHEGPRGFPQGGQPDFSRGAEHSRPDDQGGVTLAPPRPAPPESLAQPMEAVRRESGAHRAAGAHTADLPPAEPAAGIELRADDLWLLRNLPLRLVVPVALVGVAASLVAVGLHTQWWAALVAGLVPVLIGLAPIGRVPVGLRIGRWVAYRWKQARRKTFDENAVVDVPMPDGGSCGLRWDGTLLTTMLRIDPPPDTLTLLRRGSLSTDQLLPLDEIAACLRQYDVELHSADVISSGTRTASTEAVISGYAASIAPLGRLYNEILGPLPAIAHRTMWLILRLNPLDNAKAVDNRGGGPEGALRSALVATRRVANRLAGHGITASVLTTSEMTAALRELTRGIPVGELTEHPDNLEHNGIHLTSYQIDPQLFNSDGLAKIWAVRSLATTVTVRLQPVAEPGAKPGQPAGIIEVDARVRYDTPYELGEPPVAGLKELPRRQMWALMDILVYGAQEIRPSGYRGPVDVLTDIAMPTAGCGQLIGADATGSGIAVPLIGVGSRRIDIIADLELVQQVILRAIALGAGAVVHTARPGAWQGMVTNVAAPHALSLASSVTHSSRGTTVTGRLPHPAATVIVFDGVPASAPPGSATVVTVHEALSPDYEPDADVTIVQHPNAPHTVTVHTPATTTTAQLVTTPAEQHYLSGATARR
ncbi:type VII secretion protein EccE [Nocardia sp. NPDC020380]|uniref:type VII secretion protein EccE n=1 Tax=Nocardia sp. NPDC020380 TaxID=3364309 RepID=UPI003791CE48